MSILKQKTDQADYEAEEKRRAIEQVQVLKAKVEALMKPETAADIALQKQVEEYRLLLKCQSCNTNFKSHVLLKCMHTFW